ncbi:MAG TPA: ATP-binding cassette domain-containing protein [Planctomycetota bacterium]|nr:ATP-binding cassette domain-containing protein [Planctomycetota bacterium]
MISLALTVRRGAFTLALTTEIGAGITGVVGPSGSGKSTLLATIAGLIAPERGRIAVGDATLTDTAANLAVRVHQRRIGLVFQDGLLFPHLTGEANLRYGERLLPPLERRVPFARVVELLRLQPLLTRKPVSFSGGERQRLALGRALLASPRLLLLDEPLNAVDRPHRAEILAELLAVRDELAIPMLYVSHDLGEVLRLTERLLVLDQGLLVAHGAFIEVARDPVVGPLLLDLAIAARWPLTAPS